MTDRDIAAVYRLLRANFVSKVIITMPAPSCIVFREVPLRFGHTWIRVLGETYPCHQPADVLTALTAAGLISQKTSNFISEQLPYFITKQLNTSKK